MQFEIFEKHTRANDSKLNLKPYDYLYKAHALSSHNIYTKHAWGTQSLMFQCILYLQKCFRLFMRYKVTVVN